MRWSWGSMARTRRVPECGRGNLTEGTWDLDRGSFRPVDPAVGNRLDVSAWGDRRDRRTARRGGGVLLVRHQTSLRAAGAAAAADLWVSASCLACPSSRLTLLAKKPPLPKRCCPAAPRWC